MPECKDVSIAAEEAEAEALGALRTMALPARVTEKARQSWRGVYWCRAPV
jgi:hypothetical protein